MPFFKANSADKTTRFFFCIILFLYESSNSSISITKKDGKYFNVNQFKDIEKLKEIEEKIIQYGFYYMKYLCYSIRTSNERKGKYNHEYI